MKDFEHPRRVMSATLIASLLLAGCAATEHEALMPSSRGEVAAQDGENASRPTMSAATVSSTAADIGPPVPNSAPSATAEGADSPASVQNPFGITFGVAYEAIRVVSVVPGGIAANAGLKEGDVVTHLNGQALGPLYWKNASYLVSQAKVAVLTVQQKGEVTLTRTAPK